MSQLGRIGGQVLTDNLLRAGVDLAFETDLLYLDVTNNRIAVRDASPIYDLDVNSAIRTNDLTVTAQAAIDNLRFNAPDTITTSVGGIDVFINGGEIFHERLITDNLILNGNKISSAANANIIIDPSGSGIVELLSNTNITGNLAVSGNIAIPGNLTTLGTLILGDESIDTVTIEPDFAQSIIPGDDNLFAMGADAGDSSPRRWEAVHSPDWTNISSDAWPGSGLVPLSVIISSQTNLDGVLNKISAIQSNDDVILNPYTGITRIENTQWQVNDITNLANTALTVAGTGIGYYLFAGTNGMVIPAGTTAQRSASPELGETRWNNTEPLDQFLESYDGNVWQLSTGGGDLVTQEFMEELGFIYSAILG